MIGFVKEIIKQFSGNININLSNSFISNNLFIHNKSYLSILIDKYNTYYQYNLYVFLNIHG